jgi:hypothetical protein
MRNQDLEFVISTHLGAPENQGILKHQYEKDNQVNANDDTQDSFDPLDDFFQ